MTKHLHGAAIAGGMMVLVAAFMPAPSYASTYTVSPGSNYDNTEVLYSTDDGTIATGQVYLYQGATTPGSICTLVSGACTLSFDDNGIGSPYFSVGTVNVYFSSSGACDGLVESDCALVANGTTSLDYLGSPPPPPPDIIEATSSVEQVQVDWIGAIWVFLAMLFFTVWLFRKPR